MSENKDRKKSTSGYQPVERGYQPTKGKLDPKSPPKGGSGVERKPSNSTDKPNNKNK